MAAEGRFRGAMAADSAESTCRLSTRPGDLETSIEETSGFLDQSLNIWSCRKRHSGAPRGQGRKGSSAGCRNRALLLARRYRIRAYSGTMPQPGVSGAYGDVPWDARRHQQLRSAGSTRLLRAGPPGSQGSRPPIRSSKPLLIEGQLHQGCGGFRQGWRHRHRSRPWRDHLSRDCSGITRRILAAARKRCFLSSGT